MFFILGDGKMKRKSMVILAMFVAMMCVSQASIITWSDATFTSGASDLIGGTPTVAWNGSGSDVTVNGITFVSYNLGRGYTGDVYGNNSTSGGIITTGDANFDTLIQSQTWGGGVETSVALNGLTSGQSYEVQVFFNEQRDNDAGRVMTYGDGLGNNVDLVAGITGGQSDDYGQFAIGSFTAGGTSQDLALITNGFGNAHFNAILVSEVVPEPASMLLLGLGGLVLRRRKR